MIFASQSKILGIILQSSFAAVLMWAGTLSALATTPDEYQQTIDSTEKRVEELLETVAKSELGSRDTQHENEIIALIRKELPASEKIDWPGGSVETANQWLLDKVGEFQGEGDSTKRAVILTAVSERLRAISETIDDLDEAAASQQTKDQDKQKLAEILRRQEYQKPQAAEESLFQKWWREFWDWVESLFPKAPALPNAPSGMGSLQFGLQILIYLVVIGLIGFLIYKFAPYLMGRFGGKVKKGKQDRVILGERIGDDESATDLFSEAERLAREGNLRAAIRKGYIAMLCDLSDRNIVRLARHKTNRDYLRDVRKNDSLFENMTGLTRNFETNWYGLRTTEPADWEDFRTRYLQTIANVRN
ncbi:MAG: DUF4129 domain-containing protein [Acidobacteriota bacterium]